MHLWHETWWSRRLASNVISPAGFQRFPWRSLDSVTHLEADTIRAVRRWTARHVQVERVERTLGELLGTRVVFRLRRANVAAEVPPFENGIGVVLARTDATHLRSRALIEVEGALATMVVSRVIKRPAPVLFDATAPLSSHVAGAFAAVVAATARRAHAGIALRVVAVGPAPELEIDMARGEPDLVAMTATLLVGDEAFAARLVVSRSTVWSAPPPPLGLPELVAALGPVPLSLAIVACTARATAAEVASLRTGDVWLSGKWRLDRGEGGRPFGPVLLASPFSELGICARLGEDGRLMLGGETEALGAPEADMGDSVGKEALLEALGDVPVVVRVEIGEARMLAREWAGLSRGDIVALGRRIGDPVVLRVGGVAVARGDLVAIEGEIGVRVIERFVGPENTW